MKNAPIKIMYQENSCKTNEFNLVSRQEEIENHQLSQVLISSTHINLIVIRIYFLSVNSILPALRKKYGIK